MKPTTFLFAAGLSTALVSPAAAQQPDLRAPVPAPIAPAAAEPASAVTGPRIRLDIPTVEPALSAAPAPTRRRATHTFTITTLVLVLLVVIIVLLL